MKSLGTIWLMAALVLCSLVPLNGTVHAQDESIMEDASSGFWECWDDGTIDPCHLTLNGIDMISRDEGWAVGDKGRLIRLKNNNWEIYNSPSNRNLYAVGMVTPSDGWAIGQGGTLLRWDGSEWDNYPSPTGNNLKSISIVSENNVWIAGWEIYQWDGETWNKKPTPNNDSVSISMVPGTNGTDGWAVGYGGSILRWDGTQWNIFSSPTSSYLFDVKMISPTDGWAVGDHGVILHWNGVAWAIVDSPISDIASIYEIAILSATDIYIILFDNGLSGMYHWDGLNWKYATGNFDGKDFNGIDGGTDIDGPYVYVVGKSGYILNWDGSVKSEINNPDTQYLTDVAMFSEVGGWVVGSGFPVTYGYAKYWNGVSWESRDRIDAQSLSYIPESNGTSAWAVGTFGNIFKLVNGSWIEFDSPETVDINSVVALSQENVWAVGGGFDVNLQIYRGTIMQYDGSNWFVETTPTPDLLFDLFMVTNNNGWAVGKGGLILKWDGYFWIPVTSPTTQDLNSVYMLNESSGWAVGKSGSIIRFDGDSWETFQSPTTSNLWDVKIISNTDGWAVGNTILHWDGNNWLEVPKDPSPALYSIDYASSHELWAVGSDGVIMHYGFYPKLDSNHIIGSPGSYFNLSGSDFPPNQTAKISVNGHELGTVQVGNDGSFTFTLATAGADEGIYYVTVSVNPSVMIKLTLDDGAPLREKTGTYPVINIPAGIGYTSEVFLPLIKR